MSLKSISSILFILCTGCLIAQDTIPTAGVDTKYREDQFYIGVTYNLLFGVPSDVNLSGISGGVHFGFLRDMPINDKRTVAIAIGGGVSFDRYGSNLFIGEDQDEQTIFTVLTSDVDFESNSFSTATLEIPLEFRWRTSTPTTYKFWRVYGGMRLGYTYWYRSYFRQTGNEVAQTDIPEFDRMRLAATINFGYSTFNFYAYYSINPFFKEVEVTNSTESLDFKTLKVGVIFYIL